MCAFLWMRSRSCFFCAGAAVPTRTAMSMYLCAQSRQRAAHACHSSACAPLRLLLCAEWHASALQPPTERKQRAHAGRLVGVCMQEKRSDQTRLDSVSQARAVAELDRGVTRGAVYAARKLARRAAINGGRAEHAHGCAIRSMTVHTTSRGCMPGLSRMNGVCSMTGVRCIHDRRTRSCRVRSGRRCP